jgi:hypothetical protein
MVELAMTEEMLYDTYVAWRNIGCKQRHVVGRWLELLTTHTARRKDGRKEEREQLQGQSLQSI